MTSYYYIWITITTSNLEGSLILINISSLLDMGIFTLSPQSWTISKYVLLDFFLSQVFVVSYCLFLLPIFFICLIYSLGYALFVFFVILMMQYSALIRSHSPRARLIDLINQKEVLGDLFNQLRLAMQRRGKGRPAQVITQCIRQIVLLVYLGIPLSFFLSFEYGY